MLTAFIRATLEAVPAARQNSMNAGVRPAYVLGLVRDKGQPIQLVNAFEAGVWSPKGGITEASIAKLKGYHTDLKKTWDITPVVEVAIPDVGITEFINQLVSHAV